MMQGLLGGDDGVMSRFGDLEAAIMDVMWAARPLRVQEVAAALHRERPLAFNTVQTVLENLFRKGWLTAAGMGGPTATCRYGPGRST